MTQFASATFTAADGTELSAADSGFAKNGTCDNALVVSNRLYAASGAIPPRYRNTATPPSADYDVSCDIYVVTQSTLYSAGPMARCNTSTLDGYWCRWRHGTGIQLFKYVAGASTQLGSTVTQGQAAESTIRLTLRCNGTSISVFRNAETTPIISVTDSAHTAVGYAGLLTTNVSSTAGVHIDNWSADTLSSGATATLTTTTDDAVFAGIASVSALTVLTTTLADAVFSGAAGAGAVASLAITTDAAIFSGSASVAGVPSITLPVLKNNTGTVLASETGATAYIYATTGAHVVTKTAQTTNGSGVMTITDAALTAATQYRVVIVLASGAEGMDKVTAE